MRTHSVHIVLFLALLASPVAVSAQGVGSKATGSQLSAQAMLRTNPSEVQLKVGAAKPVSAYFYAPNGTTQPASRVTWTSSDRRIAKVSTSGVITGLREGKTTVSARVGARKAGVAVTVGP